MALTVGDIMDADPVTVGPDDDVETVVRLLRTHELPGVPVVNDGGRPGGLVTGPALVIAAGEAALPLPHYTELMGGIVYLEPLRRFESRLRKAAASKVRDLMTDEPT